MWFACQRASCDPREPMRMGVRLLKCPVMICSGYRRWGASVFWIIPTAGVMGGEQQGRQRQEREQRQQLKQKQIPFGDDNQRNNGNGNS